MEQVLVGRRANIGSMYFEKTEHGTDTRKYCVGYCPKCGHKQGLTSEQLKDMSDNLPGPSYSLIVRLLHAKIIVPK